MIAYSTPVSKLAAVSLLFFSGPFSEMAISNPSQLGNSISYRDGDHRPNDLDLASVHDVYLATYHERHLPTYRGFHGRFAESDLIDYFSFHDGDPQPSPCLI